MPFGQRPDTYPRFSIGALVRLVLLLFLASACVTRLVATAQRPDRFLHRGQDHDLFTNPLESYFQKEGKGRPALFREGIQASNCLRGYVATWKIEQDRLFLVKVEKQYFKPAKKNKEQETEWRPIPMERLVEGAVPPQFASWFTGVLRIPQGRILRFMNMGYNSIFEKELRIHVEQGKVRSLEELTFAADGRIISKSS